MSGSSDSSPASGQSDDAAGQPAPAGVHAVLAAVSFLFSINYIVGKIALRSFDPLAFSYLRVAGSAAVLVLIAARSHSDLAGLARREWRPLAIYSLLGVVINQVLFMSGLALTTAHQAAILITSIPVFTHAAAIVAGRERATVPRIAGIALAGAGALTIIGFEGFAGSREALIGNGLILLNCASYATYLVFSKGFFQRVPARSGVALLFVAGSVLMLPFTSLALARQDWSGPGTPAWIALAVVIAGPTVAAYLMNAWALARADSSLVAVYVYLQPLIATLLAALFLGERIGPAAALAGAMIIGGVFLAGRTPSGRPAV
jgi:drug/metabolite transporter (DMT)-like permease